MKILSFIIALSFVVSSCYDRTLIEPGRLVGNIKIKVYGKDNLPAKNARVIINPEYFGSFFDDSTDSNGEYSVQLLDGEYSVKTIVYDGKLCYSSLNNLIVIGGLDRVCEYWPYKNQDYLYIKVLNNKNNPWAGLNVALLYKDFSNNELTYQYYIKYQFKAGVTDSSGRVLFQNIPLGSNYSAIIYIDDTTFRLISFNLPYDYLIDSDFKKEMVIQF